jgi:uncharacterized protein YbaR (Trm112 family)
MINEEILSILACPVCKSDLHWDRANNKLICMNGSCNKEYIIGDSDVPILVPDKEGYEKFYGWKYHQKDTQ